MKRRTVRVVVWPVNLETMPGIFPDAVSRNQFEAGLEAELDGIFASQINAWFDVSVGLNKPFDYLDGTSGGTTPAPYTLGHGTKQNAMIDTYRDGGFDINVFLIDNLLLTNDPADPWAGMILGTSYPVNFPGSAGRENSVVANKSVYYTNSTQQKHTIAHEIGHLLLGPGHPDKYEEGDPESGGPAPLPSLPGEHPKRLMHSNSAVGKLLVKGEWDRAEVWLSGRPNGDN